MSTECGTRGNELIKSALHDLKDLNSGYTKTRKVISLFFDEKVLNSFKDRDFYKFNLIMNFKNMIAVIS